MAKGTAIRFLIYGAIVAYLAIDIYVKKGPVHDWLLEKRGSSLSDLREQGVAALVFQQPILESQVEYRMQEYLYVRGRALDQVSPAEYKVLFMFSLEELIVEHLLRVKTHHNFDELPINPALDQREIERDQLVFSDALEMTDALQRQGYIDGELALRAQGHLQQQQYLAKQITVTPEESPKLPQRTIPELRQVRHIFLSSWEKDPSIVRAELELAIAPILSGTATFEQVASEVSEDQKSKLLGGNLGWLSAKRLPPGLATLVFNLPVGEPQILPSKLGWHYLEVLSIKPASQAAVPLPEVQAQQENQKRTEGLRLYLQHLRIRERDAVTIIWQG